MPRPPLPILALLVAAAPVPSPLRGQATGVVEGTLTVATRPARDDGFPLPGGEIEVSAGQRVALALELGGAPPADR